MGIAIFIFIIIFCLQLVLGLFAWGLKRQIESKFSHPISSLLEPAQVVEKYYEDQDTKFRIMATDEILDPAYAEKELLVINKAKIYKKDLYTNFFVIYQAELTKSKYEYIRKLSSLQSFAFVVEISVFILGIATVSRLSEVFIYFAIALQILTFILTLIGFIQLDTVLSDSLHISTHLLKLDEVEQARALGLKSDLRYSIFEYPFELVWRIFQFLR